MKCMQCRKELVVRRALRSEWTEEAYRQASISPPDEFAYCGTCTLLFMKRRGKEWQPRAGDESPFTYVLMRFWEGNK